MVKKWGFWSEFARMEWFQINFNPLRTVKEAQYWALIDYVYTVAEQLDADHRGRAEVIRHKSDRNETSSL